MKRILLTIAIVLLCASSARADRILNFANKGDPEYLDPGLMTGVVESSIIRNVIMGLTTYNPKTLEPLPELAESWEISSDGLTYTFHIRKNANWSDGTPVTAGDFVYSWERVLNPKTGARYAEMLFDLKGAVDYNSGKLTDPKQLGFKVVDDKTLVVTLAHPVPYFLYILAHETSHAVPKWVVEKHKDKWTLPENILSNGPFMVKEWIPQKEVLVMKNPTYWDADKVKLDGVRFFSTEDRNTVLKKYENGEVDVAWELPPVQLPTLKKQPDFRQYPFLATYHYRLNATHPILKNVKVRQALAHAINRDVLVNQFLNGLEIPSASEVPKGVGSYTPATGLEFNPELAKKLLAEAGYADPATFPKIDIMYNSDELHRQVAQVIQQMWKQYLGINVGLENQEWKSYLKSMANLQYDVCRAGWVGDFPDPNTFLAQFVSYSAMNQTGWKNSDYDGLIEAASKEVNASKRLDILQQAEKLLLTEAAIVPIFTYTKKELVKPYVKGYYETIQDIHPFKEVRIEEEVGTPSLWKTMQRKTK